MEMKPSPEVDKKFQVFMEAAPDAIVIVDHKGKMVMFNSLAERMFGYQRAEMLQQNVEMLIPAHLKSIHEKHRSHYVQDPKTRRMGEGQALTGQRKDGSHFPIEISLSPFENEGESLVISIIRDVTSRKQLEAKFRGLLESAPDGIVVVGSDAKIVIVNSQTEKMFGYTREELLGQPIEILVPEKLRSDHVHHRSGYIQTPKTRAMGAGRVLSGRRKDGSELPIEISLSPLETEQGVLIMSIVRDITERRRAEELIKASLREKEALLKEIHHRVKNNLQVTSSLLRLQSSYIQDPETLEMFAESQNRIRSMALVHEKLYKSSDLSRINFSEYIDSLVGLLFRSFGVNPGRVTLKQNKEPLFLSIESAVPCGLIVNELVSNCMKHGFPGEKYGEIYVALESPAADDFLLKVKDNGIGLPANFSLDSTETLGLQLVKTLVNQLNGTIQIDSQNGTTFSIRFSDQRISP